MFAQLAKWRDAYLHELGANFPREGAIQESRSESFATAIAGSGIPEHRHPDSLPRGLMRTISVPARRTTDIELRPETHRFSFLSRSARSEFLKRTGWRRRELAFAYAMPFHSPCGGNPLAWFGRPSSGPLSHQNFRTYLLTWLSDSQVAKTLVGARAMIYCARALNVVSPRLIVVKVANFHIFRAGSPLTSGTVHPQPMLRLSNRPTWSRTSTPCGGASRTT